MSTSDRLQSTTTCQPFLKWPGGKRWLASTIADIIGETGGVYFEPFLGAGAVFFRLRPAKAVLSDRNRDLIEVYRQIKLNLDAVLEAMKGLRPSKARFDRLRASVPRSPLERAVRFLYLNRTAFNG